MSAGATPTIRHYNEYFSILLNLYHTKNENRTPLLFVWVRELTHPYHLPLTLHFPFYPNPLTPADTGASVQERRELIFHFAD